MEALLAQAAITNTIDWVATNRSFSLTVLEAGKSMMKLPADLWLYPHMARQERKNDCFFL